MARLCLFSQTRLGPGPRQRRRQVQEEGSLPSERSGEGGAKRRSAQAKRGRLGCLLRAPEAEPLRKTLVSLLGAERMRSYFVVAVAMGRRWVGTGPLRRVAKDAERLKMGRSLLPSTCPVRSRAYLCALPELANGVSRMRTNKKCPPLKLQK